MRHSLIVAASLLLLAAPLAAEAQTVDAPPTGSVVARVGDRDITLWELNAETPALPNADPATRRAAQMATLQNMVARTVLAQAALEQGVDKSLGFRMAQQRATDTLLAQGLEAQFAGAAAKPTSDDAARYMAAHPDIFAQRKIFVVDQIRTANTNDPSMIKQLEPLKTLPAVEALFNQRKTPFQRTVGNIDAVGVDPRMLEAIVKLAPGEVFVIPNKDSLLVNQIKETRIAPFTGPKATDYALQLLARERTQEAVSRQVKAAYDKARPTIRFNPDYAPPAPPAGPGAPGGR